jgi:hydrogenase nickel incorporation protein HypA/HybF
MHEEALLHDLRRKLDEVAVASRADRIARVRIRVGALCHVTPESLRRRWPLMVAGSPASDATLEVEAATDTSSPTARDVVLVDVVIEETGAKAGG